MKTTDLLAPLRARAGSVRTQGLDDATVVVVGLGHAGLGLQPEHPLRFGDAVFADVLLGERLDSLPVAYDGDVIGDAVPAFGDMHEVATPVGQVREAAGSASPLQTTWRSEAQRPASTASTNGCSMEGTKCSVVTPSRSTTSRR